MKKNKNIFMASVLLLIFGKLHRLLLSEKVLRAFIARSTFCCVSQITRGSARSG